MSSENMLNFMTFDYHHLDDLLSNLKVTLFTKKSLNFILLNVKFP